MCTYKNAVTQTETPVVATQTETLDEDSRPEWWEQATAAQQWLEMAARIATPAEGEISPGVIPPAFIYDCGAKVHARELGYVGEGAETLEPEMVNERIVPPGGGDYTKGQPHWSDYYDIGSESVGVVCRRNLSPRGDLLWLSEHFADLGLKAVGESLLESGADRGDIGLVRVLFSSHEQGGRELNVCPELLAELWTLRAFRAPSEALLASFRARSRIWARENGMSVLSLARVLPGTLVLAMTPNADEMCAFGALAGRPMRWGAEALGAFMDSGRVQYVNQASFWNVFRYPLSSLSKWHGGAANGRHTRGLVLHK